ncbi:MAG: chemotaxis protein CheW [Oceanococcus sp.]
MNELLFPPIDESVPAQAAAPSSGFVCFMLADQRYGVAVGQVREVLRLSQMAWVPGAPAACLGVVNLRGQIVSVLDLRQMLGQAQVEPDAASRLLVIDHQDAVVALLVDRVLELVTVADQLIESTPRLNHGPVPVHGVVSDVRGPLFLLKPEQLVSQIQVIPVA